MKKTILLSIIIAFISITGYSQVPNGLKYQAELRNAEGEILVNTPINVRVTILEDKREPHPRYREKHSTESNALGLIHIIIGEGTPELGTMEEIQWGEYEHLCQIEIDDGSGYVNMGMTQFLSVPYALQAQNTAQITTPMYKFMPWSTPCVTMGSMQYNIWTTSQHEDLYLQGYNYSTQEGNFHGNNTIINHEDGLVGIGSCMPTHKLTVQDYTGNDPVKIYGLKEKTSDSLLIITGTGVVKWRDASTLSNGAAQDMDWEIIGDNVLTSHGSIGYPIGNVGIGTQDPQAKLDLELPIQSYGLTGGAAEIGSENNNATGDYAIALGYMNEASDWAAISMGNGNRSLGWASTTMNTGNTASGEGSTAMGVETTASGKYSTTTGAMTQAMGYASMAMGLSTIASPRACAVVGANNIDNGTTGDWIPTEPVFIVGNGDPGSNPLVRNNALTILKNGKTGVNTDMPTHLLHINNTTNSQEDPLRVETLQQDDSDSLLIITGTGVVKWRDATTLPGGSGVADADWEVVGNNVLTAHGATGYPTGNVGIGTTNPQSQLSIGTDGESKTGLYIYNDVTIEKATAITAEIATPIQPGESAYAIHAKVQSGTGHAYGIRSEALNNTPMQEGRSCGVWGRAGNATNMYNYGVFGEIEGENTGAGVVGVDRVNHTWYGNPVAGGTWAGYFIGRTYVSEQLGINTVNPVTTFDLNGGMALKVSTLPPGFIDHTDRVVLCNDAGDYHLPSAATYPGLIITIKNIFLSGDVHIYPDPNTAEQIEANIWGSFLVLEPMDSKTIISDGNNWWISSKN